MTDQKAGAVPATGSVTPPSAQPGGADFVERRRFPRPGSIPTPVEGNSDADWALWESAIAELERPPAEDEPGFAPTEPASLEELMPPQRRA